MLRKRAFLNISQNSLRNNCAAFANTVTSLQAVRLATLLKKDTLTDVSELAVCRSPRK